MARKAITLRICEISRDESGKPVLVSEGDGFTADQIVEAYMKLGEMRDAFKKDGKDPYALVLLPDGKGGPYLPPI